MGPATPEPPATPSVDRGSIPEEDAYTPRASRLAHWARGVETHRYVALLLILGLVLAFGVTAIGRARLDDVRHHLDEARERYGPASHQLATVQTKLAEVTAVLQSYAPDRPELLNQGITTSQRAREAWASYMKRAAGIDGEDARQRRYGALNLEFTVAASAALAAPSAAGFQSLVPNLATTSAVVQEIQLLYQDAADAAVDAARRASGQVDRDTNLAGIGAIVVWLLMCGLVLHLIRCREREHAVRERQHGREARRGLIETRLQRGLEFVGTEEASYRLIERAISMAAPDVAAEVIVADSSRAHFRQVAATLATTPACPVGSPMDCPAATRGQTRVWPSSSDLDACPWLENIPSGPCSALCVPVSIAGKTVGVVHVTATDHRPPDRETIENVELIARKAGERIGMLRAFARSETQARTDPLTGLFNRRSLEAKLRDLTDDGRPYVVAFGDLDHFKMLNDVHGHDAGDRALRLFARIVRDTLRPHDIAARYGGEEFLLVLPDCSIADAHSVLERIRDRLAHQPDATVPPFTVSFGLAISRPDASPSEIIEHADSALLDAKARGRNFVSIAGDGAVLPAPRLVESQG